MPQLKLFMLMLGCTPPGRHIEQHDIFFGVAESLNQLVPEIKAFWPEPERIHIDAWREVNLVDGYQINVVSREGESAKEKSGQKLFFINLGGYQPDRFEEQHYIVLAVGDDRSVAIKKSKETLFFKHNGFKGATSHIDDKYGIDVDDLYEIEDILSPLQKSLYKIELTPTDESLEDPIHLGYLKMSTLEEK